MNSSSSSLNDAEQAKAIPMFDYEEAMHKLELCRFPLPFLLKLALAESYVRLPTKRRVERVKREMFYLFSGSMHSELYAFLHMNDEVELKCERFGNAFFFRQRSRIQKGDKLYYHLTNSGQSF